MKVIERNISDLIPAEYNPRYITEEALEHLKASIQRFDAVEPVLVNVHPDRKDIIISGHQRIKAAKSLGMEKFPCVELSLDKDKERELNIRMNKNTGAWDWDELATYFDTEELTEWGFTEEELFGNFETEEPEAEEDDYEIPDEIETDFVLGDLIEIGEHRLLCGDSTDSNQVAKLMDGEKADMVITDPPYNVNYGSHNHPTWKQGDRSIENDDMSGDEFKDFIQEIASVIKINCDGVVYCFGAQGADGRIMFGVLDEYLHNSGTIIWLKDRLVLGRSKYHNKYEPLWFGWNKSGSTFTDDRTLTNVWECDRPSKSELHPTMKPIELLSIPLIHNPKAKTCLDLFLGSGSTMVACHQLNRKCYGMELDPKYCQVIVDRMLKLDSSLKIKVNGKEYKNSLVTV